MNQRAIEKTELNKILALAAEFAVLEGGKQRLKTLAPSAEPKEVIRRAKEVLATLNAEGTPTVSKKKKQADTVESFSIEDYIGGEIKDRIRSLDINQMTPMEAFNLLWELKKLLDK